MLALFLLALAVRAAYILIFNQHRICEFGDAFYYLTTGSLLAKAIIEAPDLAALIKSLIPQAPLSVESGQSFVTTSLTGRLLMDGPVYTSYLALLAGIFGFAGLTSGFEAHFTPIALSNCFVDALSCLLVYYIGRTALSHATGFCAALLFAFYPPFILSTARCYSEPFACFLLLILFALLVGLTAPSMRLRHRALLSLAAGFFAAIVALVRPVFLPVAIISFCALVFADFFHASLSFRSWLKTLAGKRRIVMLLAALVACAVVFVPWWMFSRAGTGTGALTVSRAPAYNLFIGNNLESDGWKTWPQKAAFPGTVPKTLQSLALTFASHPVEFLFLELKKVGRLWCGGWNDFQYSLLGMDFAAQNLLHQILLFLGASGACLLAETAFNKRDKRERRLTVTCLVLVAVPLSHFVYAFFEPTSRYALTAMPFVLLLAAYALVRAAQSASFPFLCVILIYAAFLFSRLNGGGSLLPFVASDSTGGLIMARIIDAGARLGGFAILGWLVYRLFAHPRLADDDKPALAAGKTASIAVAIAGACLLASTLADPAWREWSIDLKSREQTILQKLTLPQESVLAAEFPRPALNKAYIGTAFLLLDLKTDQPAPNVRLYINRIPWQSNALPWYMLREADADIPTILGMQGRAMARDWRTYRQWWAVPFPAFLLDFGKENELGVIYDPGESHNSAKLYGDFVARDEAPNFPLPSLESFSWTKGFATFDTRDPRVYDWHHMRGQPGAAGLFFGNSAHTDDLSLNRGKQFGRYRIRLALPIETRRASDSTPPDDGSPPDDARSAAQEAMSSAAEQEAKASAAEQEPKASVGALTPPEVIDDTVYVPRVIYARVEESTVSGANPESFQLFKEPLKLPKDAQPGSVCQLSFLHESNDSRAKGAVGMVLKSPGGKPIWSSKWSPTALHSDRNWHYFSYSDVLPEKIDEKAGLEVLVSPFQADRLYLHRSEVVKDSFKIKDLKVTLFPPLKMPEKESRSWLYF